MIVRSEVVIYEVANPANYDLAPAALIPDDPAYGSAALPDDFDEALYEWSPDALAMVPNIAGIRARRWAVVRAARDAAQDGGCPTPLGRVDTDAESRGKISGSVQMAMIAMQAGEPFELAWTMQDNSTVIHDGPGMVAMGVAVGRHVAACHAEGLVRRAAIDAADTPADIEAVPAEGGWPGAAG
ncbi:hypothetical protein GCM10011380_00750 [Sphingomonas metalli]|uniref:DUF4376 domain-containing protein n=1 Tax=Sphingomonas metalli TaxID=1779358 RepID=A0A916SRZ6_9SPHN|nr:DUF4376 domain-containing protein [Sphingomonas metalli]GGB15185.1 hypothetical protein GCM10011380_00750 [Sphingomonas metalli]